MKTTQGGTSIVGSWLKGVGLDHLQGERPVLGAHDGLLQLHLDGLEQLAGVPDALGLHLDAGQPTVSANSRARVVLPELAGPNRAKDWSAQQWLGRPQAA